MTCGRLRIGASVAALVEGDGRQAELVAVRRSAYLFGGARR
jgi:hypothetical protein